MAAAALRMTDSDALARVVSLGQQKRIGGLDYSGDITVTEAAKYLQSEGGVLIDVRTPFEWEQTGIADLSGTNAKSYLITWTLPNVFAEVLAFEKIGKEEPLFFICKSGGRSLEAAVEMRKLGYNYCFNVPEGFQDGWKAAGFPWKKV